ncbi:MAG: hypothetical protein WAN23_08540, partial [Candidatus Acidiferrales bacterium]
NYFFGPAGITKSTPLGIRVPSGVDFELELSRKLIFKKRAHGDITYFDYHGLPGKNGKPQPCLIQGSIHKRYASQPSESSFALQNELFWHACFDSDCRATALSGVRGSENMEPQDFESKTRIALRRLDELASGASLHDTLCQRSANPTISTKDVAAPDEIERPDMPESVLYGRLGEWTRTHLKDFALAYAWPSMLAAASVVVKGLLRANLYVGLIGPTDTGKSQAIERTLDMFRLQQQGLLEILKSGSAEGFVERVGDRQGSPVLWFPDELAYVLERAQMQGASFPQILNTMFYHDDNKLTVTKRKFLQFNARLSLIGGLVEENFEHCFGAETTFGLYDRFLFGICPSGFAYSYRPPEAVDLFNGDPVPSYHIPFVRSDVWEARDEIRRAENIDNRILEIAIRSALVCAAIDGQRELTSADLAPAWELARYEQRVRALFKPNPGRNFEGVVAHKILGYLKREPEKWFEWRTVKRATHVDDYGPSVCERALNALVFSSQIGIGKIPPPKGGKAKTMIRLEP